MCSTHSARPPLERVVVVAAYCWTQRSWQAIVLLPTVEQQEMEQSQQKPQDLLSVLSLLVLPLAAFVVPGLIPQHPRPYW